MKGDARSIYTPEDAKHVVNDPVKRQRYLGAMRSRNYRLKQKLKLEEEKSRVAQ